MNNLSVSWNFKIGSLQEYHVQLLTSSSLFKSKLSTRDRNNSPTFQFYIRSLPIFDRSALAPMVIIMRPSSCCKLIIYMRCTLLIQIPDLFAASTQRAYHGYTLIHSRFSWPDLQTSTRIKILAIESTFWSALRWIRSTHDSHTGMQDCWARNGGEEEGDTLWS